MTRLLLWPGVGCLVLLAAGGGSSAPAAETELAGTTEEQATTLTQADLEVRKAEVRVAYAKAALAEAQARVDAGTADKGAVTAAERDLEQAKLALMETRLRAQEWESQRVSLDVKDATLTAALTLLFKDTDQSFMLHPSLHAAGPVTVRLTNVPFEYALRGIVQMHGATYEQVDNLWFIFPDPDVASVGGVNVPVVGALEVPDDVAVALASSSDDLSRSMIIRTSAPRFAEGREHDLQLAASTTERPIDLQLDNVPIREAMARLAEAADMEIVVHEAVPEDIRITAKVYQVSGFRLLTEIVGQAGLAVAQERVVEITDPEGHVTRYPPPSGAPSLPSRTGFTKKTFSIFHVVPKPELSVSGTGVGGPSEARRGLRVRGEVDSPVADLLRQWEAKLGGDSMAVQWGACPNCQKLIMMPNWQFCPHCGTKLPSEEEVGAEAK